MCRLRPLMVEGSLERAGEALMPQSGRPVARKDARAWKKARWILFVAARVLIVVLTMQLSGMTHSLVDALLTSSSAADHGDCSSDESGRDCPPGCPTCHHPHGGVGALPSAQQFNLAHPAPQPVSFDPAEAEAPPNPDLPAVFRPPKRS